MEKWRADMAAGKPTEDEIRLRRADGEYRWFLVRTAPLHDELGNLVKWYGVAIDIEDRKRAEWQSRTLIEAIPQQIWSGPPDGTLDYCNDRWRSYMGLGMEALQGEGWQSMLHPDDRDRVLKAWHDSVVNGTPYEQEERHRGADGNYRWFLSRGVPLRDAEGRIARWYGTNTDIEDRKQAEEALRQSESNWRSLVEGSPYGIFRSSRKGRFLMVNPALLKMLGYDSKAELLTKDIGRDICVDPDECKRIFEAAEKLGRFEGVEVQWKRKDGLPIVVRQSGRFIHDEKGNITSYEMVVEDVTERRDLETQLRQAQKMEVIGQLAGGIAHDFNNLLFVILGRTEGVLREIDASGATYDHLKDVQRAAEHARWLTAQLLILGRRQAIETRVMDLNAAVKDARQLFDRLIGEDIELLTVLRPDLWRVRAGPELIQQVIMNLTVNARDAMPKGGKLIIETANANLDDAYARHHTGVAPGSYVMLTVSDTGIGMNAETRRHIFEPYFTTKGPDKGTGLGLAMAQSIIAQCGGHVTIQSTPGCGSTFRVYLPRVNEAMPAPGLEKRAEDIPRGSETVLLVEDAHGVRILAREYLVGAGYTVLVAENGQEAIEVAQKHHGPIHLLVTDVVMPGISGQELAGRLTTVRPEMKVLYMSGYTNEAVLQHGILGKGTALLQKPFMQEALARKVREVLDGSRSKRDE
jgi:PAS domain S-box-containing protein